MLQLIGRWVLNLLYLHQMVWTCVWSAGVAVCMYFHLFNKPLCTHSRYTVCCSVQRFPVLYVQYTHTCCIYQVVCEVLGDQPVFSALEKISDHLLALTTSGSIYVLYLPLHSSELHWPPGGYNHCLCIITFLNVCTHRNCCNCSDSP